MNVEHKKIRALIVDDESLARQYLMQMLVEHPNVYVIGECSNGFEAVKAIGTEKPDLVFLDIQMPKLNGFEVLELVEDRPAVVFVTAYEQYALDAFEAHAVDYLLKPFSAARLEKALEKVKRNIGHGIPTVPELRRAVDLAPSFLERVVVKDGTRIVIVPIKEVEYVLAEDDYISIHSKGASHLKHQTISSLESCLNPISFVRIHRSGLINVDYLSRIEPMTKDRQVALMKDGAELPISRSGLKRLKEVLG